MMKTSLITLFAFALIGGNMVLANHGYAGSCAGNCNTLGPDDCYCDSLCGFFQDCCHDICTECPNVPNVGNFLHCADPDPCSEGGEGFLFCGDGEILQNGLWQCANSDNPDVPHRPLFLGCAAGTECNDDGDVAICDWPQASGQQPDCSNQANGGYCDNAGVEGDAGYYNCWDGVTTVGAGYTSGVCCQGSGWVYQDTNPNDGWC